MKNVRLLKKLVLIFVVLLFIVLLPSLINITGKYLPQKKSSVIDFSTFTNQNTSKILIKNLSNELSLSKDGDNWRIASYSASRSGVNELFEALKNTNIQRVVSKNPENYPGLGVASDSATQVTLQKSNGSVSFLIGNIGPETGSFYIRLPEGNEVYLVSGNLKDALKLTVADWRDKIITDIDKNNVSKIDVKSSVPFVLTKNNDNKWEISAGATKKVLEDNVSLPVSQLLSLTASGFANDADKKSFDEAKLKDIITVTDANGKSLVTLTLVQNDTNWLIVRDGREDLFTLSASTLSDFFSLPEKAK